MLNESILTLTTFVPAAGAVVVALLPRRGRVIQWWALIVSVVTFGLTLHLPAHYMYGRPGFQFEVNSPWIASPAIRYHMGVDGISLWLVVLTGFLAPLGVLASWNAIATRTKEFYFLFLLQQTAMIGVFVSLDLFLYYGFWELSLVPMAILIAMFGRERGPQAALKFFLYTFIPSALFLVAILWLYAKTGTFDFVQLQQALASGDAAFTPQAMSWVALAFLVAFAVKVPVFPLHGWLGDTFSEAPTAMAMVVAGKLGLYSILRFNLGLFPAQARQFAPWMIALAVIGVLYGALVALVQKDMKRLVAYSTVSHLSFCTLGIFCLQHYWRGRVGISNPEPWPLRRRAIHPARHSLRAIRHLRHGRLRRTRGEDAALCDALRDYGALAHRTADAEWLRRRISRSQRQLCFSSRMGRPRQLWA